MKKCFSMLCAFALLLGLMIPVSADAFTLTASNVTGAIGDTVAIEITAANNPGTVTGISYSLSFDDDAFEFVGAVASDEFDDYSEYEDIDERAFEKLGSVMAQAGKKSPVVGQHVSGTKVDKKNGLASIFKFKIKEGAASQKYTIDLIINECFDTSDGDIAITPVNGSITVEGGTSTPTAKTVTYSAKNGKVIASLTELSEGTPVASGTIGTAAADSDEVYFYFFPNKGYTADGMTVNGTPVIGTDGGRKFTITADATLSFDFKPVSGTATASAVTIVDKSADKLTVFGTATNASDFGLELGLQDKTMTKYAADGADGDGSFAITLSGTDIFGTAKTYAANIYADSATGAVTTFTID